MMKILDLYYAVWANLSVLSVITRAAIVLAVAVLLVWVIARPLFFKLLWILLQLASLLVKFICLLGGRILGVTSSKSPEKYAARYNRMISLMGRCNERLMKWSEKLAGNHKFYLVPMLLSYCALMLLIILPNVLKSRISEEYLPYFSAVSDLYQRIEAPALRASAAYSPLFSGKYDEAEPDAEPNEDVGLDEEPAVEVWLSLSERGKNGSNLRAGPGKDTPVLDTLSGDAQILYLGERSGQWVHVCSEDGTEGWIHDSLVTGVPEESDE